MPKLPDFTALGQSPQVQPNLGVTAYNDSATAPGRALQGLAASVGKTAEDFKRIYDEEKRKNDMVQVEDNHNKLKLRMDELKSGDQGYGNIHGGDVNESNFMEKYRTEFTGYASELQAGLANDEQKKAFSRIASNEDYRLQHDMLGHKVREQQTYKKEVHNSLFNIENDYVDKNYESDNAILSSIERTSAATREMAKDAGYNDAMIAQEVARAKGASYAIAINAAISNGDVKRADALFNARFVKGAEVDVVKDLIPADKRAHLQDVIRKKDINYEAERDVEKKILETTDEKALLDWARNNYSGEKQDAVRKRVYEYLQDTRVANNLANRKAEDSATTEMFNGTLLADMPQDIIDNLSGPVALRLKKYEDAKLAAAASRKSIQTNWDHYGQLKQMVKDEPDRFSKLATNPGNPFPGYTLGNTETKQLLNIATNDKDLTYTNAIQKEVDLAITDIFRIKNVASERKKTGSDANKIHEFDAKIDGLVEDFYKEHNNRFPNQAETRKIIADQQVKIIKKGWLWDSEKPIGAVDIPGVPSDRAAALAKDIEKRTGQKATQEQIQKYHSIIESKRLGQK